MTTPNFPARHLIVGYDDVVAGSILPNGVFRDNPLLRTDPKSLDFQIPEILSYIQRAGIDVRQVSVLDVAQSGKRWFYFLRPRGIPRFVDALSRLSSRVLQDIHSGSCFVVIDYSREGFSDWMFPSIYEAVGRCCLPAPQVILISGDLNCEREHATYVQAHGVTPIRVHYANMFRQLVADAVKATPHSAHAGSSCRAKYLSLNRRNRLHRVLLVSRLCRDGLLDSGLVSLPKSFDGLQNEERILWEALNLAVPASILDELRSDYPKLAPRLSLVVDTDDLTPHLGETYPDWPYRESWFSIVTETLFFGSPPSQLFITEKLWKPIAAMHPFVLFGHANSLATIRSLGFLTFDPLIDESYDSVADHELRFNLAYGEVARLASSSEESLASMYRQLEERLEHNCALLRSTDDCKTSFQWLDQYLG